MAAKYAFNFSKDDKFLLGIVCPYPILCKCRSHKLQSGKSLERNYNSDSRKTSDVINER